MKKIIVFGASGDTGKQFVDYLLNTVHTDFEIIASGTKYCRYYEHNNIKYIKVDIAQKKDFCQMMYKALISDGVHKSKIIERKDKPNSPQYIMDIQNVKDELGYEPKYNYIEMLKDLKREMNEKRFDCQYAVYMTKLTKNTLHSIKYENIKDYCKLIQEILLWMKK